MENRKIVEMVRREVRGLLKLSPWVLAALLLGAVLWRTDLAAVSGLFQSDLQQSPLTPTATSPPPTAVPTQVPTQAPTAAPTVAPTSEVTSTPVATATATLEATATALPAPPTETPTLEPSATPTTALPSATPVLSPTAEVQPTVDESQRYPDEDTALRFDWGMLFDSVALGVSYIWLCCGILLFLAVPLVFVLLWVASKRRTEAQQEEEQPPEE